MQLFGHRLQRANISEAIASKLRTMIIDGRLRPGTRINEVHLAAGLGVSRTPLREALSSLANEGAVTVKPRRGFFVAPLSAIELEQLYSIRPVLDPEALRIAGVPAHSRLRKLRILNRRLAKEKKPERIVALDDEWHLELIAECANGVLLEMIRQIMRRTRRYELALMRERGNVERAVGQHEKIVAALERARLAKACLELKRNMQHGHAPILQWLREREAKANHKPKRAPSESRRRRSLLRGLILLGALFLSPVGRAGDSARSVQDLEGLWQSTRSFGPDLRGPIVVQRGETGWRADLKNQIVLGKVENKQIAFDFGDGQMLRLTPEEKKQRLTGWWTQGRSPFHPNSFLTPVELRAETKNRFSGEISPLEERITFYMPVTVGADKKATTYLCNPEQNAGRLLDVRRIDLVDGEVRLLGFPFGSEKEETVGRGVADLDNDTLTVYVARVGQGYEFQRVRPDQASGFYPRDRPGVKYSYAPPPERADGWPVAHVDDVGISREKIERFVQLLIDSPITGLHSSQVHALLIARQGKLVLEEYFHGYDRHTLHDTRSAAKSVTSTLLGAAIQAHYPISTATSVYNVVDGRTAINELEPRRRDLKVEHLLTMSSGFHCDDSDPKAPGNEDAMQQQRTQPDWYRFTLDLPMVFQPGEKSIYCSGNANLLGGVIARATGHHLEDLFRHLLAEPLGIKHYALNTQPTGEPYMGGGQYYEPRDFLKFGQLMLDGGTWRGRRVVGADWAARAVTPHVHMGDRDYGYLWWSQEYPYRDGSVSAFYAAGNGGQIVMAMPALQLVIGFMGGNYSDPALYIPQRKYVPEYLLPAVTP